MKCTIGILFFCLSINAMSCRTVGNEDENSTDDIATLLMKQCPIISACTGRSVNNCAFWLADDMAYDYWHPYLVSGLKNRARCLAAAADCEAVIACDLYAFMFEEVVVDISTTRCGSDEETYCENDLLVWCHAGEYDEEATPHVFDLSLSGAECNTAGTGPATPAHASCTMNDTVNDEGWSPEWCDGHFIVRCVDNEIMAWDCRTAHPDFTCHSRTEDDSPECGIPPASADCELNSYHNHGDSGWCEGSVAVACVAGKAFRTDCAALDGGDCEMEDNGMVDGVHVSEAFCVSDKLEPFQEDME